MGRVTSEGLLLILIVPKRPGAPWFPGDVLGCEGPLATSSSPGRALPGDRGPTHGLVTERDAEVSLMQLFRPFRESTSNPPLEGTQRAGRPSHNGVTARESTPSCRDFPAFSTIAICAAACYEGFARSTLFTHPLMKHCLVSACRLRPPHKGVCFQLVLCRPPFEPIANASLRLVSASGLSRQVLMTVKSVSDLCASYTHKNCLIISGYAPTLPLCLKYSIGCLRHKVMI